MPPLPDWLTGIIAIAGLILVMKPIVDALGLIEKLLVWLSKVGALLKKSAPGIPPQTLAVIPEPRRNALWWGMGKSGEKPVMQICADFYVTNKLQHPIRIGGALLKVNRWFFGSRTERGDAMVKDVNSPYSGNYPIPPHTMTRVRAHFFPVFKPFKKPPKLFSARVAIIDQYGNEHWVYARFKHHDAINE